eukprot:TRINITY_DN682_c1_g2_i2.p1 TRINITY_DN682_c1_g2~~TRINITY_DN682_c1_g2_i2.p1  ORF type:complete len:455 (+),score=127.04 TRINITY_DN682_c1_g2_i2:141-1367(+)
MHLDGPAGAAPAAASDESRREYHVKLGPLVGPRGVVGPGGAPGRPDICSLFWQFGFCSFGADCDFKHPPERKLKTPDMDTMLAELIQLGHRHAKGDLQCMVCATKAEVTVAPSAKVGETSSYSYCPHCGNFYFYPHVQLMLLQLVHDAALDYNRYKFLVDAHAKRLPSILSPPWYYEAHRWGTSRWAWTLTSPQEAEATLRVVFDNLPSCRGMVSMGSGTGYVESVFAKAAGDLGRQLQIDAYDLTPLSKRRLPFEVTPKLGGVGALYEHPDLSSVVLLLCWPPFGSQKEEQSTMGFDCLELYAKRGGRCLIYIGDVNSTGDWRFHERLASHWEPARGAESIPRPDNWIPQKMGLLFAGNDGIMVYVKRDKPAENSTGFVWTLTQTPETAAPPVPPGGAAAPPVRPGS